MKNIIKDNTSKIFDFLSDENIKKTHHIFLMNGLDQFDRETARTCDDFLATLMLHAAKSNTFTACQESIDFDLTRLNILSSICKAMNEIVDADIEIRIWKHNQSIRDNAEKDRLTLEDKADFNKLLNNLINVINSIGYSLVVETFTTYITDILFDITESTDLDLSKKYSNALWAGNIMLANTVQLMNLYLTNGQYHEM